MIDAINTRLGAALLAFGLLAPGLLAVGGMAQAQPAADAARGKKLFLQCSACHALSAKAPAKIGPHLEGIVGRKARAVAGFRYSPAMQKANIKWDVATLDKWLARPSAVVPGTSMAFVGLSKPEDRAAIIAYLKKPMP